MCVSSTDDSPPFHAFFVGVALSLASAPVALLDVHRSVAVEMINQQKKNKRIKEIEIEYIN
jgi:hypothetical protein